MARGSRSIFVFVVRLFPGGRRFCGAGSFPSARRRSPAGRRARAGASGREGRAKIQLAGARSPQVQNGKQENVVCNANVLGKHADTRTRKRTNSAIWPMVPTSEATSRWDGLSAGLSGNAPCPRGGSALSARRTLRGARVLLGSRLRPRRVFGLVLASLGSAAGSLRGRLRRRVAVLLGGVFLGGVAEAARLRGALGVARVGVVRDRLRRLRHGGFARGRARAPRAERSCRGARARGDCRRRGSPSWFCFSSSRKK